MLLKITFFQKKQQEKEKREHLNERSVNDVNADTSPLPVSVEGDGPTCKI